MRPGLHVRMVDESGCGAGRARASSRCADRPIPTETTSSGELHGTALQEVDQDLSRCTSQPLVEGSRHLRGRPRCPGWVVAERTGDPHAQRARDWDIPRDHQVRQVVPAALTLASPLQPNGEMSGAPTRGQSRKPRAAITGAAPRGRRHPAPLAERRAAHRPPGPLPELCRSHERAGPLASSPGCGGTRRELPRTDGQPGGHRGDQARSGFLNVSRPTPMSRETVSTAVPPPRRRAAVFRSTVCRICLLEGARA